MRKRLFMLAAILAAGFVAALGVAGPVSPAAAAPASPRMAAVTSYLIELYTCGADPSPPPGDPSTWRICDGTWYHAQPNYGNNWRSVRIVAEISYNPNSNFHTVAVTYLSTRFPDVRKRVDWYCRYSNGALSAKLSQTSVGGGLASAHSWNPKYQPCNGYGEGLVAKVNGGADTTDTHNYVTVIDINTMNGGTGKQFGNQAFQG